jgi:predicted nucleic acid-binding protein
MAATDSAGRVVVCDAGPLIHRDELGCIALLEDFGEVLVPSAVWSEVLRYRPAALAASNVPFRQLTAGSTPSADLDALARTLPLHRGEHEALQVAREQRASLLLTDDTAARLAARTLGVSVHSTIGILFRAIRRGRMTGAEVAAVLQSIPTVSTMHVKRSLLAEFIRRAQQSP